MAIMAAEKGRKVTVSMPKGSRMATKTLTVKLPEELYQAFVGIVGEKSGCWRGDESSAEAIESAVAAGLMLFLQNLDRDTELPEFRDYIFEKYPELDEDFITMIEDLIKHHSESVNSIDSQVNI